MTTDFVNTARDIITASLHKLAVIGLDDDVSASISDACLLSLNAMLKSWQTNGVLWKQETVTQAFVGASAVLPTNIRGVNAARFIEGVDNERQMQRFERDEYYRLPNKAAIGTPTIYYIDRGVDALTMYIWPVPATGTLALDADIKMDTITDLAQVLDIPEEWAETVIYCLAVRVSSFFGQQIPQEVAVRAQLLERELFDNYRPASYLMGPDV